MTATQTANPRFIVQHGTAGIRRVVSVEAGKSVDGVEYTSFEAAAAVRDRLNGVAPAVVETPAPSLPKPQGHLRKGEHRPVKTGRAARTLIGSTTSPARRRAVLAATASRWNAAHHPAPYLTVSQYMTERLGVDREFARRYAPVLGKKVREAHIAKFGTPPAETVLVVTGRGEALAHPRLTLAAAYDPADIAVLDAGARNYKRTSALIGA